MKFYVENDLSLFEFHDSMFSLVSYDGTDLIISAAMVSVHKNTPQNPSDYDMEIASAQVTFQNFSSAAYEPGRTWKTSADGTSHPIGSQVIFRGQDAISRFLEALQKGITVYHFEKDEVGYSIGGCGIDPYFEIRFNFDGITVSWEEYNKKAWYELHRQYQYDTVLQTPNGDKTVKLTVCWHVEPIYHKGNLELPPAVHVGCTFAGKEYWGHGSDHLWIDAFADLQRQLPAGVFLKCCLTCRHGNLCPVGNDNNEVFCTKDVLITKKSDLYFYTEDDAERPKRSKQYCNSCPDHQAQTDGYYTYNDYFHFLKQHEHP